jgi:trimeric autotransporter adhesin
MKVILMKNLLLSSLFLFVLFYAGCKKDSSSPTAPTTGTIAGKVLNSTGDTAIVGAAVSTNPPTSSVFTGSSGEYSLDNVSPGNYTISAAKSGYFDGSVTIKVTAGNSTAGNIQMTRVVDQNGMIKGVVTNAGGDTLIVGASITTSPATSSVTTNSLGEYIISNVAVGPYTISATKSGYNPGNTAVNVTTGKVATGDIKMNVIVNHAPTTPVLVSPSTGATGQNRTLTLTWTCTDSDGDNITYDVYLDKNSSPTQRVASAQTATSYSATNLDSAATYYWKVIAKDSKGASSYSATNSFMTLNIPAGMIAYYPFNGNANDESGNGHNGTNYGATLTTDRFSRPNRAYYFNGSDNHINFHSDDLPTGNNPFIVTGWFKTSDAGGSNGWDGNAIFSYGYPNVHVAVYAGALIIASRENNFVGPQIAVPSHIVSDGAFHFFVYEYKNNHIRIFLDGILVVDQESDFSTTYYPFQIGIRKFNPYFNFDGTIDDIRIYNRTLSDSEIQSLYHEGGWTGK